jgi:hypothetical protein
MEIKYKILCPFLCLACIIAVGLGSCSTSSSEEGLYCIDCRAEEPDSDKISIDITINSENPEVPILVFKNKYDPTANLDTIFKDTVNSASFSIKVALNKFYSIQASYKSGSKVIHAIDGGLFETKKLAGCQNTCWQTVGGKYDLKLKE